jgi:hypothetical protein
LVAVLILTAAETMPAVKSAANSAMSLFIVKKVLCVVSGHSSNGLTRVGDEKLGRAVATKHRQPQCAA